MLTTRTLTVLMVLVFTREMCLANVMTSIPEGAVPSKVALFTAGEAAFSRTFPGKDFLAVAGESGSAARIAFRITIRSPANLLLFTCSGSIPLLES